MPHLDYRRFDRQTRRTSRRPTKFASVNIKSNVRQVRCTYIVEPLSLLGRKKSVRLMSKSKFGVAMETNVAIHSSRLHANRPSECVLRRQKLLLPRVVRSGVTRYFLCSTLRKP